MFQNLLTTNAFKGLFDDYHKNTVLFRINVIHRRTLVVHKMSMAEYNLRLKFDYCYYYFFVQLASWFTSEYKLLSWVLKCQHTIMKVKIVCHLL